LEYKLQLTNRIDTYSSAKITARSSNIGVAEKEWDN